MRGLAVTLAIALSILASAQHPTGGTWPTYGGDAGGQRYSSASQITRENVASLHPVWTYHTHALETGNPSTPLSDFEATPILFQGSLYLSTPFNRVIALDPSTGTERWSYDPGIPPNVFQANYTSRGVAAWAGTGDNGPCPSRIFVATLDARLIAIDAATGKPCTAFGNNGIVDLKQGVPTRQQAPYRLFGNTSPPTVVGNVVIVGSAVGDNQAVDVEPGYVHGFDARTGALLWTWNPMVWADTQHPRTGGGNAWSVLAADEERGIVYIPTGSPSPDFYGGLRKGDNRDADSLVALDAATGKKLWAFQLIHHDVWDYDTASEPLLFEFQGRTPAVAIAPKTGSLFVLNRVTGEPLYPVEERPVPKTDIPGEELSPTQPFSSLGAVNAQAVDFTHLNGSECDQKLRSLRYEGIFTPPSLGGTLQFPGSLGGVNWGSMALDPQTNTLFVNTNGSAYEIRLLPQLTPLQQDMQVFTDRKLFFSLAASLFVVSLIVARRRQNRQWAVAGLALALALATTSQIVHTPDTFTFKTRQKMLNSPDAVGEVSPNQGAPYRIYRRVLQNENGQPCTPQPWGSTTAINLDTGAHVWQKPLGTMVPGQHTCTVNFGAPIATAGGLLFTAATSQPLLRAIDKATGEEVWAGALPVPAQSTPMTYTINGRQFVVIAAGGHGGLGTPLSDSLVAFALQ